MALIFQLPSFLSPLLSRLRSIQHKRGFLSEEFFRTFYQKPCLESYESLRNFHLRYDNKIMGLSKISYVILYAM